MKKLYFLNEEESKRILKLHKDATKRQYLTENNKKLITEGTGAYDNALTDDDLRPDVDTLISEISGWVDDDNITEIYGLIKKYSTLFAINDDTLDVAIIEPAIKRITTLYSLDENANLRTKIQGIGDKTLSVPAMQMKNKTLQYYDKGLALKKPVAPVVPKTPQEIAAEKAAADKAAAAKAISDKTGAKAKKTEETRESWKNFPCVLKHPLRKEEIYDDGEVSYLIGEINYESDGKKVTYAQEANGNWKRELIEPFTCDDREFKPGDASRVRKLTPEQIETWKNFPCVPKHPMATEEEAGGEITYLINDINYFSDGKKVTYELDAKGNFQKKYVQKYTCNDPEFKTTRSGSTVKQLTTPSDAELDAVLGKL